jgi:hypothetical protein
MPQFIDMLAMAMSDVWTTLGVNIQYKRREKSVQGILQAIATNTSGSIEELHLKAIKREYVVQLNLIVIDGEQIKPKEGDVIIEGNNEYEVKNGYGKTCFQYCDPTESFIRIYTQKIK